MTVVLKYKLVILFVIIQFVLDLLTKIYGHQYAFLVVGIKAIKLVFLVLFFGILWKENKIIELRLYVFLTGSFLVGQLVLFYHKTADFYHILLASKELVLLLFPFVFWNYLLQLPKDDKAYKQLKLVFELFIIFIVITSLFGIVFPTPFLRTYGETIRFGTMGLLHKSITASYFYITALSYFYQEQSKGTKYKIGLALTVIASLFVGTKAVYLFVFLLAIYHIIRRKYYKQKMFYIVLSGFLLFMSFFHQYLLNKFKYVFDVLYNVYIDAGFLSAITSIRDQRFVENSLFYSEHWTFLNYLFGGRIVNQAFFELSVLDIMVFFGIFGGIYYLYTAYKLILNAKIEKKNCFFKISLATVFFVSIFAGQFFINISAITIVLLGFFFILNEKEENL